MHRSTILLHRPRLVRIEGVKDETPLVRSFVFTDDMCSKAEPGQFGMVWVPGVDEIPMSLLPGPGEREVTIALKVVGEGSTTLYKKKVGDYIGIRGPYGQGFTIASVRSALLAGGGTGIVPLVSLTRKLLEHDARVAIILGARTGSELLYLTDLRRLLSEWQGSVITTTDDGSLGIEGVVPDAAASLMQRESFDQIYTCGPERMMKKLCDMAEAKGIPFQAALEREFKCGSGICGSCCIGQYLVCQDGPVFNGAILGTLDEFGRHTRNAAGQRVPLP